MFFSNFIKKYFSRLLILTVFVGFSISNYCCDTGLEPSGGPGVLRVCLQSSQRDTTIVIVNETYSVGTWLMNKDTITVIDTIVTGSDTNYVSRDTTVDNVGHKGEYCFFPIRLFQAKVFNDDNFAYLTQYLDIPDYSDWCFDILHRINYRYPKYTVFETYIPPGQYDSLQVGLSPAPSPFDIVGIGAMEIPVELPPDEEVLMNFDCKFTVSENDTTEILLEIEPLKSVKRYRDSYLFCRDIKVSDIQYLP
jgi:hypothetical protein